MADSRAMREAIEKQRALRGWGSSDSPARRYTHPENGCGFSRDLRVERVALGAGPICPRCGVRYWVEESPPRG